MLSNLTILNITPNHAIQKRDNFTEYDTSAIKIQKWYRSKLKYRKLSTDINHVSIQDRRKKQAQETRKIIIEEMKNNDESKSNSIIKTRINDSSNEKVDRILDFLKDVENQQEKFEAVTAGPSSSDSTFQGKLAESVFDGVKSKIIGQQIEIDEMVRDTNLLKSELRKCQEAKFEQEAQHKLDLKSKLGLQRKEYETIIKRHLSFIDALLLEKQELTSKSESLAKEVRNLESGFSAKTKSLDEQHSREIKVQKDMWMAAEKLKRDKWIQEKSKLIKEQTVKSLEPEIQRMLSQHKQNTRQIEETLLEQMRKEKQNLSEEHSRQIENLREKFSIEKQKACEEERDFARQRYQKQYERDEMEFQQQKRKIVAEYEEQKHNQLQSFKNEKQNDEKNAKLNLENLRAAMNNANSQHELVLSDLKRNHHTEMNNLRERLVIEKEEWQEKYMQKIEAELQNREKSFKEKLLKEREKEIELIIERLEAETGSNASDISRKYKVQIEKMKSEMANEVKQLRDEHSMALDKVISLQESIKDVEEQKRTFQRQCLQLQHSLEIKETVVNGQVAELTRLKTSEAELSKGIQAKFQQQLDQNALSIKALNEKINDHKSEISDLKRRHEIELEQYNNEKERIVMDLEVKIRKTIAMKDSIIKSQREQQEELSIRNIHLEKLIERQRQELLK